MSVAGSLDTKLLVRLIVQDDAVQTAQVTRLLEQALVSYEDGGADFGEYLHLALAQQALALQFFTLDTKASRAIGAKLLKA